MYNDIGQICLFANLISETQYKEALEALGHTPEKTLGQVLVDKGFVSREALEIEQRRYTDLVDSRAKASPEEAMAALEDVTDRMAQNITHLSAQSTVLKEAVQAAAQTSYRAPLNAPDALPYIDDPAYRKKG